MVAYDWHSFHPKRGPPYEWWSYWVFCPISQRPTICIVSWSYLQMRLAFHPATCQSLPKGPVPEWTSDKRTKTLVIKTRENDYMQHNWVLSNNLEFRTCCFYSDIQFGFSSLICFIWVISFACFLTISIDFWHNSPWRRECSPCTASTWLQSFLATAWWRCGFGQDLIWSLILILSYHKRPLGLYEPS